MMAGGQGRVQFRSRGRGGAGEAGGERGWCEVRTPAPTRPRRVRGGMRISPRVMWRELAHVYRTTIEQRIITVVSYRFSATARSDDLYELHVRNVADRKTTDPRQGMN